MTEGSNGFRGFCGFGGLFLGVLRIALQKFPPNPFPETRTIAHASS